jgi:putative ABC transport system substrate-binding protein
MKRRQFITLIGSTPLWSIPARAQQPDRRRRVGVLLATAQDDPETKPRLAGFREELEKFGWSEDRNLELNMRFAAAPNVDQARSLAKELVALRPDVILAQSTPITAALQQEAKDIPIVFVFVNDPIGSGFIASLARPAGNLTGLTLFEAGIAGKWLAMLKEIAPGLARAGLMFNPKTTSFTDYVRDAKTMANSLGVELVPGPIENADDIRRTVESFSHFDNDEDRQPSRQSAPVKDAAFFGGKCGRRNDNAVEGEQRQSLGIEHVQNFIKCLHNLLAIGRGNLHSGRVQEFELLH